MKDYWTEDNIPNQTGRTVIITGSNIGLGFETARTLALKGAKIIMACRNIQKADDAKQKILHEKNDALLKVMKLDLASISSIKKFSLKFIDEHKHLHILINNAGVMMVPFSKTEDGFEMQFGTNHLGHYLLTRLLFKTLLNTDKSRVVTLSSMVHAFGNIDFFNLNAERSYNRIKAYSSSKLANLLFAFELNRRFKKLGSHSISVAAHPGWSATNLQQHALFFRILNPLLGQNARMGALPALYASTAGNVQGGDFYGPGGFLGWRGFPKKTKANKLAYNQEIAEKLWELSDKLINMELKNE